MGAINEFRLLGNNSLFNNKDKYIVPLYQRAYSWTEKEIEQLIEDINDFTEENYYLGSLIVHKRKDSFEVIDGQQRLTTLYILFSVLNLENDGCLTFECRDKSNYTLSHLKTFEVEDNMIESSIIAGKNIIQQKIETGIDKMKFIEKLSRIIIYRIEVPEHTDLNRYFEIMNTRGEQLEQHDILKASLMSCLQEKERNAFALIWDSCADMTGYVQMHFPRNMRDELFGQNWDYIIDNFFEEVTKFDANKSLNNNATITKVLNQNFIIETYDELDDKDDRVRFESVIDFPYFLQHVLKVMIENENITNKNPDEKIIKELLDDKKLLDTFNFVLNNGVIDNKEINKRYFSITFVKYLIKCRFLFDKYIIKREYPLNDEEGVWSIKVLRTSGQKTLKKPYYSNTIFHTSNEWEKTYAPRNMLNIMIQSCLRVSYTSPKIMHWITKLLSKLYSAKDEYELVDFNILAEDIAKAAVKKDFIDECEKTNPVEYKMGVNTPHIALNFLDYLIWKDSKDKYKDFIFEFRNSVEHWYPQHPSDGTFPSWPDAVDTFGNLCIIQRNVNSRFSNMAPEAKKSTYKDMISKGSLKLRIMANCTSSSIDWKDNKCMIHEEKMIKLLKDNL